MNRMLTIAAVVSILIIGSDLYLRHRIESRKHLVGAIRTPFQQVGISPETVQEFRIGMPGETHPWVFRQLSGHWRIPQVHNAYALSDRADQFISEILECRGTVVLSSPAERSRFGLDPTSAISVHLLNSTDTVHLVVQLGRAVPGRNVNESFLRPVLSDTVFHIHSNPLAILGDLGEGRPPIIDPHIFPQSLSQSQIVNVTYAGRLSSIIGLYRILADTTERRGPAGLPDGPIYTWEAKSTEEIESCNLISANAYLRFLRGLEHTGNLNEADIPSSQHPNTVTIQYNKAAPDTIDIYLERGAEQAIVRNRRAGQTYLLPSSDARLVFPSREAVVDSLPTPSPYQ